MKKQRIYIDTSIGYNVVNLKNGYKTLEIRNPKELINYGEEI